MKDAPSLFPVGGLHVRTPSRRHFTPQSPARPRPSDELIADLAPATAVDALRNPGPALSACLGGASPSEKAFVMRTAVASQTIQEWLDELSEWPWPAGGGPAGFRESVEGAESGEFGSVPASEALRYEARIEEIGHKMEELNIEEIKAHVLHNHIMPLSRPGTPVSEYSGRSVGYTRMEDLSAVITAVIIQALPNLSRLSGLLNIWLTRLVVLRQVSPFLSAVYETEVALKSAWDDISITGGASRADANGQTTITWNEFHVMRLVLEKKVTGPARILDYMLDRLEGLEDTLPDEWLDRTEAVEKGYGDWVVACEARIREAEWAAAAEEKRKGKEVVTKDRGSAVASEKQSLLPSLLVVPAEPPADSSKSQTSAATHDSESSEDELGGVPLRSNTTARSISAGARLNGAADQIRALAPSPSISPASTQEDEDEPQLPPLIRGPRLRTNSDSPPPSAAALARAKFMELDAASSKSNSPSPFRAPTRMPSRTLRESPSFPIPSIEEDNEDEDDGRPITPYNESSFVDGADESPDENLNHDQLQKQISNILESIPGKFTLRTRNSSINLNPPDFKPPRAVSASAKPPTRELRRRSRSNLSSRASTPGFTLVPAYAKNPRPRTKSTQQDIKVYHLSRSSGEPPIKLFIRCVGEGGQRVMVRVGGGWADLGEYLKEYATHHGRRSGVGTKEKVEVEVRDLPGNSKGPAGSSPPSRPASALESPMTPLHVRKTRRSFGAEERRPVPRTPGLPGTEVTPPSGHSSRSRSSSRVSWAEDDSPMLGLAGPKSRHVEMSEENRAWVASITEKVRLASGEHKPSERSERAVSRDREGPSREGRRESTKGFGDMGQVGGTKRLFRKGV